MGGSISFTSEFGKGTTFQFTIKLQALAQQEYSENTTGNFEVVVAAKHALFGRTVAAYLNDFSCTVTEVFEVASLNPFFAKRKTRQEIGSASNSNSDFNGSVPLILVTDYAFWNGLDESQRMKWTSMCKSSSVNWIHIDSSIQNSLHTTNKPSCSCVLPYSSVTRQTVWDALNSQRPQKIVQEVVPHVQPSNLKILVRTIIKFLELTSRKDL
jgi:hypothetical protein